jgi:hypothetical protein
MLFGSTRLRESRNVTQVDLVTAARYGNLSRDANCKAVN